MLDVLQCVGDLVNDRMKDCQVRGFEALQVPDGRRFAVCSRAEGLEYFLHVFADDGEDGAREELQAHPAILSDTQKLAFDAITVIVFQLLHRFGDDSLSVSDQDDALDAAIHLHQLLVTVFDFDGRDFNDRRRRC